MQQRHLLFSNLQTEPLLYTSSLRGSNSSDAFTLPSKRPRRQSSQQQTRTLCCTACLAFVLVCCTTWSAFGWGGVPRTTDVSRTAAAPVVAVALSDQTHLGNATGPATSAPVHSSDRNAADDSKGTGSESATADLAYPVWWYAPFYAGTGYSTEAISYVASLLQTERFRREDLWVSHSGDQILSSVASSLDPETHTLLQEQEYSNLLRRNISKEALNRPAIAVCHSFPDCWLLPADRSTMNVPGCPCPRPDATDLVVYKVGRSMFETNGLPRHLVDHCNAMDEIWVPTDFNRQTFTAAGVAPEKIRVVPQGIDASQFDPDKHPSLVLRDLQDTQLIIGRAGNASISSTAAASSDSTAVATFRAGSTNSNSISSSRSSSEERAVRKPYVFMSVFKWETRKGWDVLLSAFLTEFKSGEAVELHIITKPFGSGKQDIKQQVLSYLQEHLSLDPVTFDLLPPVYLHTSHIDDATYFRLYTSCDCVVLPTRGEGWGRPQMEAMAMGKPIITTNWSGPTAYINDAVAYPLSTDGLAMADADMNSTTTDVKQINKYFAGQYWAQPSVKHLKQLIRHVYTNPGEAAAKGRAARQHIQQYFTPKVLADVVKSEILRIQAKIGPGRTLPPKRLQKSDVALCTAYPELCKQGALGVAEASRRAQSAFSQYRTNNNMQLSLYSGELSVQDMIKQQKRNRRRQQQQQQGAGGIHAGKELAIRPSESDGAVRRVASGFQI